MQPCWLWGWLHLLQIGEGEGRILCMLKYAILEIGGKQYSVEPGRPFEVTLPGQAWEARVLLLAEGGKIKVGKPYLKEKLRLKVLDTLKGEKIRVAKYHAKANYRKVHGFRPQISRVVLEV